MSFGETRKNRFKGGFIQNAVCGVGLSKGGFIQNATVVCGVGLSKTTN